MKDLRILTIQDVSCYGQCSITVALPILSAMGVETAILPTAILSTHTAGFKGFTFHDMKDELPSIVAHWKKEGLSFDAVYTGYLGHKKDVDIVLDIASSSLNKGPLIVDPAFGDAGRLYGGFDLDYVKEMRALCAKADVLLPNLTEACFLLDIPYVEIPNKEQIASILAGLKTLGAKAVVLKGIGKENNECGFVLSEGGLVPYVHPLIPKDFHGTGDVFASSFVGAYVQGKSLFDAAVIATDYTYECIRSTVDDASHPYGVHFEKNVPNLLRSLGK